MAWAFVLSKDRKEGGIHTLWTGQHPKDQMTIADTHTWSKAKKLKCHLHTQPESLDWPPQVRDDNPQLKERDYNSLDLIDTNWRWPGAKKKQNGPPLRLLSEEEMKKGRLGVWMDLRGERVVTEVEFEF